MRGQPGFFDIDERLKRLSDLGDYLEAFLSAVDFEMFRGELNAALVYSDGAQGGRPPFDPVMMFKILVIQAMDNLSDERCRVPDQRSHVVHAVSGPWPSRSSSRRAHDLAVSREAHEGGGDSAVIRPFRRDAARIRLHRHVGAPSTPV